MRIQHNIMAMNSYRNYTGNNSALSKNLEKLSSGYKINRAGDDAAGLAISEKMRAQITGLETAQANAQSGINLVQTAEGALTEVHDMLNRMVELADQSANGTYDDGTDRANLQKEFNQLRTEIDRIADASNFNGQKLLDGTLTATVSGTEATTEISFTGTGTKAESGVGSAQVDSKDVTVVYETPTSAQMAEDQNKVAEFLKNTGVKVGSDDTSAGVAKTTAGELSGTAYSIDGNGKIYRTDDNTKAAIATIKVDDSANTGEALSGSEIRFSTTSQAKFVPTTATITQTVYDRNGKAYEVGNADDAEAAVKVAKNGGKFYTTKPEIASGGLTLQIGDTSNKYNKITLDVGSIKSDKLGISTLDISKQTNAADAVDSLKDAINTVSGIRGDLGATQNRLEHTINNLSVMTENIQDAESNIRDVDVAAEMMQYTKNNILVQSAQAMLAQANQAPQGVLQLLQ